MFLEFMENLIIRGERVHEKPISRRDWLKGGGAWTICWFKGAWQEIGGACFWGALISQCTLWVKNWLCNEMSSFIRKICVMQAYKESKLLPAKKSSRGCTFFISHLLIPKSNNVAWLAAFLTKLNTFGIHHQN